MFVENMIRNLFFAIDKIIYGLVSIMYNLLLTLSGSDQAEPFNILNPDTIKVISNRLYAFLLIFLIFRISLSALKYIADPNAYSKVDSGIVALFKHIFITIALIIVLPLSFSLGRILQHEILSNSVLVSIVFVDEDSNKNSSKTPYMYTDTASIGSEIAFITFSAFFNPNCTDTSYSMSNISSNNTDCTGQEKIDKKNEAFYEKKKENPNAIRKISEFYGSDLNETYNNDGEKIYIYNYSFLISTISGGFLAWILLVFCFDIGIRMIKLVFLEIIHPIVVMSYLNPKSKIFNNWVKEYISTYMIIFVRLFIVFLAIMILGEIANDDTITSNKLMFVFIILSIFMAAKKIPEMVKKIFNIDTSFSLNPLKRLEQAPLIGKSVQKAGVVAGVAGSLALGGALGGAGRLAKGLTKVGTSSVRAAFSGKNLIDKSIKEGSQKVDGGGFEEGAFKERFKGFYNGKYQTVGENQIQNKYREVKDQAGNFIKDNTSEGIGKDIKNGVGFAKDKLQNAGLQFKIAAAVANNSVKGDKAPGFGQIFDNYKNINANSIFSRYDNNKEAKREVLKSDITNTFRDNIMAKYDLFITSTPLIVPDPETGMLKVDKNDDGSIKMVDEKVTSKDMKRNKIILNQSLQNVNYEIDNNERKLSILNNNRNNISVSDQTTQVIDNLNNQGYDFKSAVDPAIYSSLQSDLKISKENGYTKDMLITEEKLKAIDNYRQLNQKEIANYNEKMQIDEKIDNLVKDISVLENNRNTLNEQINKLEKVEVDTNKRIKKQKD